LKIKILLFVLFVVFNMILPGCSQSPVVTEIKGVKVLKITRDNESYTYPVWSPKGDQIAYQVNGGDIMIYTLSDFSVHKVREESEGGDYPMIWDKQDSIQYEETDPYKDMDINSSVRSMAIESGEEQVLLEDLPLITGISWNPNNGSQLAVGKLRFNGESPVYEIYLYDIKKGLKELIIKNGLSPKWSPKGDLITYDGPDGIYVFDIKNKESRQVYKQKGENELVERMTWSPNGKWIAFRKTSAKENGIFVVSSQGTMEADQILDAGVSYLDWSPKGDKLVFTTMSAPYVNDIYIMEVPDKYQSSH
jgi:Tol biopolymer transport system component